MTTIAVYWMVVAMSVIEVFLFIASTVAAILHLRADGRRCTTVSLFHIVHTLFCLEIFSDLLYNDTIHCSVGQIVYNDLFMVMFLAMIWLFFSYWESVLTDKKDRYPRSRNMSYLVVAGLMIISSLPNFHCFALAFWYIMYAVVARVLVLVDSTRLGILFYRRLQKLERNHEVAAGPERTPQRQCSNVLKQSKYFIAIALLNAISIIVAIPPIVSTYPVVPWANKNNDFPGWQGILFVVNALTGVTLPACIMLLATWRRHSLVYATNDALARRTRDSSWDEAEDMFQFSDGALEDAVGFLRPSDIRKFAARSSGDEEEATNPLALELASTNYAAPVDATNATAFELAAAFDVRHHLATTAPLTLNTSLLPDRAIGALHIEESLVPPPSTLPLTAMYVQNVVVPAARQALSRVNPRQLAEETRPQNDSTIATMELQRKHAQFKEQCEALHSSCMNWSALLKAVVTQLDDLIQTSKSSHDEPHLFKTSREKGALAVAFVPCNLQTHTTTIYLENSGRAATTTTGVIQMPRKSKDVELVENAGQPSAVKPLRVVTTTYGAPAAHALKLGKYGGLRRLEEKQRRAAAKAATAMAESTTGLDPREELEGMRLAFELHTRSAVCLSQALGAAVAAAVEALSDCVRRRDAAVLQQWEAIGMLLLEVCLLSTQGKEELMLDDMAGALGRLRVTLLLEKRGDESDGRDDEGAAGAARVSSSSSDSETTISVTAVESRQPGGSSGLGDVLVTLAVWPDEAHAWVASVASNSHIVKNKACPAIDVVPVLFNLGVNEMQTVANLQRLTSIQTEVNRRGLEDLMRYGIAFEQLQNYPQMNRQKQQAGSAATSNAPGGHGAAAPIVADASSSFAAAAPSTPTLQSLLSTLEGLIEDEASGAQQKAVDLPLVASFIARRLHGCRTTSCKSAKDRTSMFQTLEVVRLAASVEHGRLIGNETTATTKKGRGTAKRKGNEGEEERVVLEELRGPKGVRLQNCLANVGKAKYAFNKLQVKALPLELRPPSVAVSGGGAVS